jgi:ADP-heptose:LPS heptosyltransferase
MHRFLDRSVGKYVLAPTGLFSRKREFPADPRRIGLIQPTTIGDMVLASGLIAHIHANFPNAEIHLFQGQANRSAASLLATDVVSHCCDFTKPLPAIRTLRACSLDILVDLVSWASATALITRLSRSRFTIGFCPKGHTRGGVFDRAVEHSCNLHETENFRRLANQFGRMDSYHFALRQDFPDPGIALPFERLILIHTRPGGSRAAPKTWPREHWTVLARRLSADGYHVGFTGSAADRADIGELIAGIDDPAQRCFSLCGELGITELAYVMQRACLVVSVDTAILHLAAALGCRVIGLHGPTLSRRWGAKSTRAISIDSPHPAAGYICFGFERHPQEYEIMRAISPDTVYSAIESALAAERASVPLCHPA